ncbi:hypothetical protein, partial [Streptomyces huiliensis]|uniref:hypothetical protein n=1 Tax=Streptomyces huiliensis TaxID=2876027 RepID=UPI001CBBE609
GRSRAAGDAAVVLVLKRLADAERDGDRVLALLDDGGDGADGADGGNRTGEGAEVDAAPPDLVVASHLADDATADDDPVVDNSVLFGHPHAAAGLLAVATAVTALDHGVRPRPGAPADAAPGARTAEVVVPVLEGPAERIRLRAAPAALRRRPARQPDETGAPRVEG